MRRGGGGVGHLAGWEAGAGRSAGATSMGANNNGIVASRQLQLTQCTCSQLALPRPAALQAAQEHLRKGLLPAVRPGHSGLGGPLSPRPRTPRRVSLHTHAAAQARCSPPRPRESTGAAPSCTRPPLACTRQAPFPPTPAPEHRLLVLPLRGQQADETLQPLLARGRPAQRWHSRQTRLSASLPAHALPAHPC